jgi:ribosomal protein S18 acetylase RimI-like enzyme
VRPACPRQATDEEIEASRREDPSINLALPSGVFLVARQRYVVLRCAGLRLLPERVGEVKRLLVAPAARGRGLEAHLMGELERIASGHCLSVLRLDTRHDLVESRRLYAALG